MKPLPSDPMGQYQRHFDALMQDWREAGTVTRDTPRANAVIEICRQSTRGPGLVNSPGDAHGD